MTDQGDYYLDQLMMRVRCERSTRLITVNDDMFTPNERRRVASALRMAQIDRNKDIRFVDHTGAVIEWTRYAPNNGG